LGHSPCLAACRRAVRLWSDSSASCRAVSSPGQPADLNAGMDPGQAE